MAAHHVLDDRVEHLVYGYLDGALPPVLKVASGDTVTVHCLPAGGRATLPPGGTPVLPSYLEALDKLVQGAGAHILTGPIHVDGAAPGDVLQIDILSLELREPWGFVALMPTLGTLPEWDSAVVIHPVIDAAAGVCRLPWGKDLALDPFFGILGTSPPRHWGRCTSNVPRAFGGNMDNKELRVGTTLYLPVLVEGGLLWAGDGHGVQGDGEVCITALETSLAGTLRLTVRKDLGYKGPFAENATHLIAIGIDEDLDDAARQAVREMIREVCRRSRLTPDEAYMLCSLAGDLRVTQTVDGNKGCHMMLAKAHLP
jgi:acetamidase/formamidase